MPKLLSRPALKIHDFHGTLTVSPEMLSLFELIERVACSDASVLVRGQTGTGKELVARALHRCSPRKDGPFRTINCATLTPELLASELFGHMRGAFTGAVRDRQGLFALADGGTIFLDEIAEISLDIQSRLYLERERILDALKVSRGRKAQAAEILGVSRSTLWRKIREYRISG